MSNRREKLSGAKYRKIAKERLDREEKVLAKVPKLECFFSNSTPKTSINQEIENNSFAKTSENSSLTLLIPNSS